jgi:sulfate transport system ATP-binding protein
VLLLDEPFGALDAKVRKELRRWLRRLHDDLQVTSVFVTHDQEEALEVADRVVVMNHGRIEQAGAPDDVYAHPANAFVYGFLGTVNRFHGRHVDGTFSGAGLQVPVPGSVQDGSAVAFARPHDLDVARWSPGADGIVVNLVRQYSRGASVLLELERDGEEGTDPLEVEMPGAVRNSNRWRANSSSCGRAACAFSGAPLLSAMRFPIAPLIAPVARLNLGHLRQR